MRYIFLLFLPIVISGCFEATFPIGEGGKYGEAYAGYRLPYRGAIVTEAALFRDK